MGLDFSKHFLSISYPIQTPIEASLSKAFRFSIPPTISNLLFYTGSATILYLFGKYSMLTGKMFSDFVRSRFNA